MELTSSDILIIASVGVIGIVFALWRLLYVPARSEADTFLTDGAVLMVTDGIVHQASVEARDMLGTCEQMPIVRVLDEFLRRDSADARDAVNRLEMTGDPVSMLVYDRTDRAYELIGAPAGGMIRLIFRDAGFLDNRLKAVEERLSAADAMVQSQNWERVTLRSLVAEAPIIVWNRSAEGEINWADGEIATRSSTINADQAVDLIVARTKLNTQPSLVGEPQKSRIEIVPGDGADAIALQVIEVIRPNGDRVGFATDAGTAASAERTLTRFVQTMTETFAHLTVGLAIFDRNQTLALFNPALVQMWQLEPSWLARRPSLRDIVDELRAARRLPELQDFHKWRAELLSLFDNTEAADYEELWHLSNGSNIRVLARPHPHGSLAFIFDDVTERMRLEQRYRHSIDLRRVTLDRLNEGVAVFGSNGLLQFINQAFHDIWGTNSDTVYAAMHIRQFIPLCQQLSQEQDVWKHLHSFVTGEEHRREWEARIVTHAGYILNARFVPLPDGSTMAVFTNITDSRLASIKFSEKSFSLRFALAVRDYVSRQSAHVVRKPLVEIAERAGNDGEQAEDAINALATDIRETVARMDELTELVELTKKSKSAMSRIVADGLNRYAAGGRGRADIEYAMEEGLLEVLPNIERRTPYLATFANVATLLGLLGTIIGLIAAFTAVANADPAEKATLLSQSISIAMNTTAFGLMVAIPLLLVHSVLQSKTSSIVESLEIAVVKFVNAMEKQAPAAAQPKASAVKA